jgi:hypothetical protein
MIVFAAWHAKDVATIVAPTAVLVIGVITLLVNGERAERRRRRDVYARGLAVALAYAEMPFEIRRRRHETDQRSAERVRLASRFSEVQAELSVCHALITAEGNQAVLDAYTAYVAATRVIAGGAAREAWTTEPITADRDVNMPDLGQQLQQLAPSRDEYVRQMRLASRSSLARFRDATAPPDDLS